MNTALAETYSNFSRVETNETFLREDEKPIEISEQRIRSFLNESKESSTQPHEEAKEKNDSNILPFPLKDDQPLIALAPKMQIQHRTFNSSIKWEGYVIKVYNDSFLARITNLSSKYPDEEVEIEKEAISKDDLPLVKAGSVFNWHIGYETEHGTKKQSSIIRFRRLPVWTKSDIKIAEALEKELNNFLYF
ncbi:MAG: hypothetical protein JRJ44_01685 [Deltaproteobacteria bacterium]|nr:hypothetical protein [Deltaproteobacteria bacterium]